MVLLLLATVFLTVVLAVYLVGQYWTREYDLIQQRIKIVESLGGGKKHSVPQEESWMEKTILPLQKDLAKCLSSLTPIGLRKNIQNQLMLAGNPFGWQVNEFLVFQALSAVFLPFLLTLLLFFFTGLSVSKLLIMFFLLQALGMLGPQLWLKQKVRIRQKQIICALPDTLDLLSVSVEAGLGFDSALAKVVEKTKGALAEEMAKVLQEVRIGKTRKDALKDLTVRTGVDDLRSFIAAIIQADQLGVSITNVLKIQAEQMREKRRQRAEETAMKAPVKMLFPLVFFIFPSIFIILLGPAVIQLILVFSGMKGK